LASNRYQGDVRPYDSIHGSLAPRIVTELSLELPPEKSLLLLKEVIDRHPTSVHLYDLAIRLYGRLRRYDEIHEMISGSIAGLEAFLPQVKNPRQRLAIVRTVAQLRSREASARTRASRPG
jgi:hypothetical protein